MKKKKPFLGMLQKQKFETVRAKTNMLYYKPKTNKILKSELKYKPEKIFMMHMIKG